MYALFSNALSIFLQPFFWVLGLLLLSLFIRKPRLKKGLLIAATGILLIFSNPLIFHTITTWWEPRPVAIEELNEPFDYAIILGGFTRLYATPLDRLHLNSHPNRFTQAIELHRLGKVQHLVFVSGSTTAAQVPVSEAKLAARTAIRFGVPETSITALSSSQNTFENAKECHAFISKMDTEPTLLLITSASHMRRARACFEKSGLKFSIFPTDHQTERNPNRSLTFSNTIIPAPGTMNSWSKLFHEWVGLLVYRIRGWV